MLYLTVVYYTSLSGLYCPPSDVLILLFLWAAGGPLFHLSAMNLSIKKADISATASQPHCHCSSTISNLPIKCVNSTIMTVKHELLDLDSVWGDGELNLPSSYTVAFSFFLFGLPTWPTKPCCIGQELVFSQDKSPDPHWSLVLFTGPMVVVTPKWKLKLAFNNLGVFCPSILWGLFGALLISSPNSAAVTVVTQTSGGFVELHLQWWQWHCITLGVL